MAATRIKYAQLDDDGMKKVSVMEEETGAVVLVLEKVHPMARLTDQQVQKIQALERELGVILIAYSPSVIQQ